jgi:hypothetical protein
LRDAKRRSNRATWIATPDGVGLAMTNERVMNAGYRADRMAVETAVAT